MVQSTASVRSNRIKNYQDSNHSSIPNDQSVLPVENTGDSKDESHVIPPRDLNSYMTDGGKNLGNVYAIPDTNVAASADLSDP